MTVSEIYASAETLARELTVEADHADTLLDEARSAREEAKTLAARIPGDDARDLADLTDSMYGTIKALSERLLELDRDAGNLECELDDFQHDYRATSDLAEIALDVERGIRDHSELIEACKATTLTYVL